MNTIKPWQERLPIPGSDAPIKDQIIAAMSEESLELRSFIDTVHSNKSKLVGEVIRTGMASYGKPWHQIHWYDKDVDVPHGTKLYIELAPDKCKLHDVVRNVLKYHGLTKVGDGVVEADLIDAMLKAL